MGLFGARKQTPPLKELLGKAKENLEKRMAEKSLSGATDSNASSSRIGDLRKDRTGPLPTDPDGTATTSEVAREELGDYLGGDEEAVTLPREVYNQAVQIHNQEVREVRHPSQMMQPVLPVNADKHGNRLGQVKVYTILSDDESSLSPPLTTSYGGSEIFFPSQTPRETVLSPLPTTDYEGSLLGIPLSALPQDPFSTPRASAGIIA